MISWITVLAFLQTCKETAVHYWHRFRRGFLVTLAHSGTRNMVLLKSGAWVDATTNISDDEVICHYNAEKHQIVSPGCNGRMVRWPWIGATFGSRDLMDFFEGLRHSAGHVMTEDKALALYMYQKGWAGITGTLQVTLRDGSEKSVSFRHGYTYNAAPTDTSQIDYIR
jgi:hypothetical protein